MRNEYVGLSRRPEKAVPYVACRTSLAVDSARFSRRSS